MELRTIAIIQARTGSTRLPGKVLKDLAGEPMLARVVERTRRARSSHEVVVATSDLPADDAIAQLCVDRGWACFRGSEADVLGRYYQAALEFQADIIVRITSDCPITDPQLIDRHVERLLQRWAEVDLVTNMLQQSFPLGLAVEALPFDALVRMNRMSLARELREHVTTLAYVEPEWFQIDNILHTSDLSSLRWTVDTAEDLELVRRIFEFFGNDRFTWEEALSVVQEHPDWAQINNIAARAG
jgi:spore coat polysaccharide biosynthesis protein SpsF